jgi:hypothetical protein
MACFQGFVEVMLMAISMPKERKPEIKYLVLQEKEGHVNKLVTSPSRKRAIHNSQD